MAESDDPTADPGKEGDAELDEVLAGRAQRGDPHALEVLVRRYLRRVHAVAASFLSERVDIEDAAQETFLRALRALQAYDATRPFAPWLYQIARNVARDRVAARERWLVSAPGATVRSESPSPDAALETAELRTRVQAEIARLPERQRTAFYLCDVEGYRTEEVALLMELTAGTVRSHVHHARRSLRRALAETRVERGGSTLSR